MEKKYLKKVLAGFSIAGLISGGGLAVPGPAAGGSGWSGKTDAGSVVETKEPEASGWSGSKSGAGSTEETKEGSAPGYGEEEKKKEGAVPGYGEKQTGDSGWSGSK